MPSWLQTATTIINQVAVEVGLTETTDPYASTDAAFIQLRGLLKTAGQELMQTRDWRVLTREGTITGDGTSTSFDLPADFLRMADQSGWNRTSVAPFGNPLSSQEWQYLQAGNLTGTIYVLFRITQDRIHFHTAPPLNDDLRFDYISRYWAQASGSGSPDLYMPTAGTDTIIFDPLLMSRLLKVKFLQAKGLDSAAASVEMERAYEGAISQEPAKVLTLSRPWPVEVGELNVPDSGYGT